jgi:hypothetical protein
VTDARFPERILTDRRILTLSPVNFRAYITSMTWAVSNRTEGIVLQGDLALIPHFPEEAAAVFVTHKLWEPIDDGWLLIEYEATQTSKAQLESAENARRRDREKKRRKRAAPSFDSTDSTVLSPGTTGGTSLGKAQDRTGKDRQGIEGSELDEEVTESWPEEVRDHNPMQVAALADWGIAPKHDRVAGSRCSVAGCDSKLHSESGLSTGLCRKVDTVHEAARERMSFEEPF